MTILSPAKINSLSFRLAAGAALWITAALVVTGLVLTGFFRDYVERSFEQQLALHLDRLSAVSEVGPGGAIELKRLFSDPRFDQPYSGWYWQVAGRNRPLLRSRSLWDQVLVIEGDVQATDTPWRSVEMGPEDQHLWVLRRAVTFPGSRGVFQVAVAADISEIMSAIE